MYHPNGVALDDLDLLEDQIGDMHYSESLDTPMKADAFALSNEEKIKIIETHFAHIMDTLGLDLTDDSLKGTPKRVAKMFVQEKFRGLDEANMPSISLFQNKYQYNKMLVEKNINVQSTCEHHFLPIVGKAHVGYISSGKVIGLSKINRIVDHFARRPQVQERMTKQILSALMEALDTEDVIVVIEAAHMCVSSRGIEDHDSSTITIEYSGEFINQHKRNEFMDMVKSNLM
jgi:GTP cyclohydrolase I